MPSWPLEGKFRSAGAESCEREALPDALGSRSRGSAPRVDHHDGAALEVGRVSRRDHGVVDAGDRADLAIERTDGPARGASGRGDSALPMSAQGRDPTPRCPASRGSASRCNRRLRRFGPWASVLSGAGASGVQALCSRFSRFATLHPPAFARMARRAQECPDSSCRRFAPMPGGTCAAIGVGSASAGRHADHKSAS